MKKVITILFLSILFYSCGNVIEQKDLSGSMFIGIDQILSRTILPDVASLNPDKYIISLTGPVVVSDIEITATTKTISNLAPGTWALTVKAYKSDKIIAQGVKTGIIINTDETTNAAIILTLLQTELISGNTRISLDWSVKSGLISYLEADLVNLSDGTVTDISGDVTITDDIALYSTSLESGDYIITINLFDINDQKQIPYGEVIQVYDNVNSNDSTTFASNDFNSAPLSPSGLSAVEAVGKIELTWTDNSNIEESYIVERLNGSTWVTLATLSGGTETYTDNTATQGTVYKYRIKATGIYGDSAYIESGDVSWTLPVPGSSGTLTTSNITNHTFDLNWTEATDSNSTTLQYKVVVSTSSSNMTTASATENIDNTKTLVLDWTDMPAAGDLPISVGSLVSGTTYYVNVLVKDEFGNKVSYNQISGSIPEITTSAVGSLGLSITIQAIIDLDIVFELGNGTTISNDHIFTKSTIIVLKTTAVYESYTWIVDGEIIDKTDNADAFTFTDATANVSEKLSITPNSLNYGKHSITVVGQLNGHSYSETLQIIVGN